MKPPEGYFLAGENKVCRLKKSLYGLKQALRQWNAKLTSALIENGFSQNKSDYSLFTKQFMHSSLKSHLKIVFKILRYLTGSPCLGIHNVKDSGILLRSYSDADWAKCVVTRKSVTRYCVFMKGCLVSWKRKKQNTLFKSSTEAEYRALALVVLIDKGRMTSRRSSIIGSRRVRFGSRARTRNRRCTILAATYVDLDLTDSSN
ncbi:ribonuclease H-like domain-containing protein [Tanacetum coccineum]